MEHRNTRDPLGALEREVAPPAALEARVRRTLEARGLLYPRRAVVRRWLGATAAAVALFAAGYVAGQTRAPGTPIRGEMARYALFLYEDAAFDPSRPEAELVAEYGAWAAGLGERGQLDAGEKLATEGIVLERQADSVVVASRGVTADAGVLTGLFIIRATSESEALRIAGTCPHLKYGGRIDVRAIEET